MRRFLSRLANFLEERFAVPTRGTVEPAKLIGPINDAAKEIGTHSLTLMITSAYIAVSAARVEDLAFLFGNEISLPVVNVGIPVRSFFFLAPALLLVLHAALLLQQYFLLRKMALAKDWPADEAALLNPSLAISRHSPEAELALVRLLVFLVYNIVYFVVPLAVLVYLQACSVRFHDPYTRYWIGAATALDIIGAVGFILVSAHIKENSLSLGRSRSKTWLALFSGFRSKLVIVLLTLAVFATFYSDLARFTDQATCNDDNERVFGFLKLRRHLVLNGRAFAAYQAAGNPVPLNFRNFELPCADFTGAHLNGADFRGAKLQNTKFQRAHLQGALFSPAALAGADFSGADLTRAHLASVNLQNAHLESAFLQEADLSGADLSGANARKASFLGANLAGAVLRGANFQEAKLAFTDLSEAHLEFAQLWGARLDGASFSRAAAAGADFQNARLRGARDLELRAVDLRGANLWHLDSCRVFDEKGQLNQGGVIYLADLRYVELDAADWEKEKVRLRAEAKLPIPDDTWKSWTSRESQKTCLTRVPLPGTLPPSGDPRLLEKTSGGQLILYSSAPGSPFADWPEQSSLTEEAFYRRFASFLIEKACWELSTPTERKKFSLHLATLVVQHIGSEEDTLSDLLRQEMRTAPCNLEDQP